MIEEIVSMIILVVVMVFSFPNNEPELLGLWFILLIFGMVTFLIVSVNLINSRTNKKKEVKEK